MSFLLEPPSISSQIVACVNHIPTGQKAVQCAAACDVVHEFVCQNLDFLETISEVPEPNSNDRTQSSQSPGLFHRTLAEIYMGFDCPTLHLRLHT